MPTTAGTTPSRRAAARTSLTLPLCLAAVAGVVTPTSAQQAPQEIAGGHTGGVSVGTLNLGPSGVTMVTVRWTDLRRHAPAAELGLAFAPFELGEDRRVFAAEFSTGRNISLPGATLLLKAGVSGLGIDTPGGRSELYPGFHTGFGTVARAGQGGLGFRIDVTHHFYYDPDRDDLLPVWSVGVGLTSIPRPVP